MGHLKSKVALAPRQFGQGRREGDRSGLGFGEEFLKDRHDAGGEDVHAEEAEVVAGAQAGDDDPLLGFRGRGLFEDGVDLIEAVAAGQALTADGSELLEVTFAGGLNGGDGAVFGFGDFNEFGGTTGLAAADVEMVADQVEKRLAGGELARAVDGVAVAARFHLFDEAHAAGVVAGDGGVVLSIAGTDHDADLFHASADDLFQEDAEDATLLAIAIDKILKWQTTLRRGGRGDYCFAYPHSFLCTIVTMAAAKTNAVRLLEGLNIPFEIREYEVDPEDLSAETVAEKIGFPLEQTFKTLVARGERLGVCLAVIPGNAALDLKALAKAMGDRKADTVPLKEVQPLTGYIRGGVTALAARKDYPVYLDEYAQLYDRISISAGQRGMQILLAPEDYRRAVNATYAPIAKDKE